MGLHRSREAVLERQRALARVLTDADLRRAVFAAEGTAGAPDSDLERGWLGQFPRQRVETFAQLLIVNRLTKALEGLPLTTGLIGPHLWDVTLEYAQAVPPRVAKKHQEALAFARFLRERFERLPDPTALLDDTLSYETAALEVQFAPSVASRSDPDALAALAADEAFTGIVPYSLPHQRVVSVRHDLEALSEAIERGQTPSAAPLRSTLILLHRHPSGALGQAEITTPTAAFIATCDGNTSLDDVIAQLAVTLSQDREDSRFRHKCGEICRALVAQGVVTVSYSAAARELC